MKYVLRIVKNPYFYLYAILTFAILLRLISIAFPFGDFDEGTYIATVRSLVHGHPLLTDTYLSQFPLFIYLLSFLYHLSPTIIALRSFSILCSLVVITCIFLLVKKKVGFLPAVIVSLYLACDSAFLLVSRTIEADIPWVCFTILSLFFLVLYDEKRKFSYFLYAAIAFGISILIKANELFIPIFLIYLVLLKECNLKKKVILFITYFIPLLVIFFMCIPFKEIPLLYAQAVKVRFTFWSFPLNILHDPVRKAYLKNEWAFLALAVSSTALLVLQMWKRKSLALFHFEIIILAWYWLTFCVFLFYNPLFPHHFVFLIVPQALIASFLLAPVCKRSALVGILLGCVAIILSMQGIRGILFPTISLYDQSLLQVSSYIQKTTKSSDVVIADEPIVLYLANRDTLPGYVDVSFVRINAGELSADAFLSSVKQEHVKEIVLASGRLSQLKKIPVVLNARDHKSNIGVISIFSSGTK